MQAVYHHVMMASSVMEILRIEENKFSKSILVVHNISANDYHSLWLQRKKMKSFKFFLESIVLLYGLSDLMNFSDGSSRILFKLQQSSV